MRSDIYREQSWAVLQVRGYLCGISSTEHLKYFKKVCISSTSEFQVQVFQVLSVLFFIVKKKRFNVQLTS